MPKQPIGMKSGAFASSGRAGLTVLEILVVVGILALLASAAVPYAELTFVRGKESELENSLAQIRQAIKLWEQDCRAAASRAGRPYPPVHDCYFFPDSLTALTQAAATPIAATKMDGTAHNFTFYHQPYLKEIPVDPFVGYATWTLHFASQTVPPKGIIDVSPVADPATRRGFVEAIDGTRYSDW